MKPNIYLIVLAVFTSSVIAVNPLDAQSKDRWLRFSCTSDGLCRYVEIISINWPFMQYKEKNSRGIFTKEANCIQSRYRILMINGKNIKYTLRQIIPFSLDEAIQEFGCSL